MNDDTLKSCTGIICLTFLVGFALYLGYDGIVLGSAISLLAALSGYYAKK